MRAPPFDVADPRPPPASGVHPRRPPRLSIRGRLFGRIADYARRYLTASVEHRLTMAFTELERIEQDLDGRLDRIESLVAGLSHATHRWQGDFTTSVEQRSTGVEQSLADLRACVDRFGPRFDEIEIKSRPLITFDEASYAVRMRDGYAMVPRAHPVFAVMVANATSEGLEPGTRRVLQALIQPGMSAADVGANVGLLTLACAVAAGPGGRVWAFEPEAEPRAQLEKTRHLNGLSWVSVFDCAIGAQSEQKIFHVSPVIGHSSLYHLPDEEVDGGHDLMVEVRRLDDVIALGQPLDVVKMDVEGAELDVLAGMPRLLQANSDIALVAEFGPSHLTRIGISQETWFDAFKAQGFTGFEILEPSGTCRPASLAALRDVMSANLVFVRPGGKAEGRLPL